METNGSTRSVVVVGGGVIGIACAHYLNKLGIDVRVVDRGKIAAACSRANCGYICPSHVLPLTVPEAIPMAARSMLKSRSPFKIKMRWDKSYWSWMVQFAKRCRRDVALSAGNHLKSILEASIEEYRTLLPSEGIDCEWRESGLLNVFETKSAFDAGRRENDLVQSNFGHGAREMSGRQLVDFEPTLKEGLAGGLLHENDASLRPDLLNQQWRAILESRGVTFSEHCELLQVVRSSENKIDHLVTSAGVIQADSFVFAMGAWSEKFAKMTGFKLPVQPGKGYSITLQRPSECPSVPMLFPEKKVGVSIFEDGFRIGSMMEFVGFDTSIPEYRINQLKESVEPFFNFKLNEQEQDRWYGFRPMTYDTLPAIGKMPKLNNGFVATGHSMLGVSMAPTTGRMIADLVGSRTPHLDPKPFDPSRFQ